MNVEFLMNIENSSFLCSDSQCPEAEFYILTNFPGVERIVVVGDPRQLPATVLSKEAQELGYGESFLGRILQCR